MKRQSMGMLRGRFEPLERRELLAGDVLVSVVHGELKIEGDEVGNQIAITAGAMENTVAIGGLSGTSLRLLDRETGLPGDPVSQLTVAVRGGAKIDLGDGDDFVSMAALELRGKVSINMGDGNDGVLIGRAPSDLTSLDTELHGGLKVRTGIGDDNVTVMEAVVRGSLDVDTGAGNDTVQLGVAAATDVDDVSLQTNGGVKLDLGSGNDTASLMRIAGRASVHVDAGAGEDSVSADAVAAAHLFINGGGEDGADVVALANLDVRHLGVFTGDGNDEVSIVDSAFSSLGVHLGSGDDSLATGGLDARFAILSGGLGEDTFNELAENNLVHDLIHGFELPLPLSIGVRGRIGVGRRL